MTRQSRGALRILYVRDTLTICGPGKTMLNTWRTIDHDRFQLLFAATQPDAGGRNLFLDRARDLGVTTIDFRIGRGVDLRAAWELIWLLRRQRIDILQTHDGATRRIGVIAAALTGVRHFTSVEGWISNDSKQRMATWLDKRLVRLADMVIAVSDRLRVELEQSGVESTRIAVLRNSIMLDDCKGSDIDGSLRVALGIAEGESVVSIVGRLSPEKGHELFLDAAKLVLIERPNTTFLIVGEGPSEALLRARAHALGIAPRVIFTGHCENVARVYDSTDVLVISSFTEGLPYVLLEAFAHRRPAVATAVGGIPEVLRDGVTGWLVSPGDGSAIAQGVLSIIGNPQMKREMGDAARATVERHFDVERRTRALEHLYLQLGG